MTAATRNGTKPAETNETSPGLSLGLAALGNLGSAASAQALAPYMGSSPGTLSGVGPFSLPQVLGHHLTRGAYRVIEQTEEQALALHGQATKLRLILQEWNNLNQQVGINTAQTFALLTALRHLSPDPDYQAWWGSWAKFEAERCVNTTDDLLVVGARTMAQILAQPVQPPGELVALWRSLFAR